MHKLLARWMALALLTAGGAALGISGVALGTADGRAALIDFATSWANRTLRGRLAIGGSEGNPLKGLTLFDVSLSDTTGRPLFTLGSLRVQYRVRDLLAGRIVLGRLLLDRPVLMLRRMSDDRWNLAEVLKLGEGGERRGPRPLVAFRDVRVDSGAVIIEGDPSRTVSLVSAELPYLRLSSPLPGQGPVRAEIGSAALTLSEPSLRVADMRGIVELDGDSLQVQLDPLSLPNTSGTVDGWLTLGDALRFDLVSRLEHLDATDFAAFTPALPRGVRTVTGAGRVHVVRHGDGRLLVEGDRLALRPGDGGSVGGRFGISLLPDGRWAMGTTDVRTDSASLDLLRALLDTVPLAGRLSGRTRASGPSDSLRVQLDWRFTDATVVGHPVSSLTGEGAIALGGEAGITFHEFGITRAEIALGTVSRLVPAVGLRGRLDGAGTLSGPWQDATFSGAIRHRDAALPATVARGLLRLDTRADTVLVAADLGFDSLQTDGIRPSYPSVGLAGAFAGDVRLNGPVTSLNVFVDLAGPTGAFRGTGTVSLTDERRAAEQLDLSFQGATLEALETRFPDTRLTGHVGGNVVFDSVGLTSADIDLSLGASAIAAVPLDSAFARLHTGDRRLLADSVAIWAEHLGAVGRGGLGLDSTVRDSLQLRLVVDSLADVRPLLVRYAGSSAERWIPDTLAGRLDATLTVAGALGELDLGLGVEIQQLRWDDWVVPEGTAAWSRTVAGRTRMRLRVDSLAVGELGFGDIRLVLDGSDAHQPFRVRGSVGDYAAVLAGGALDRDSTGLTVQLDSLAILASRTVWFLERPAGVTITDSTVEFDSVTIAPPSGASRVALAGVVPRRGPGAMTLSVEALSLSELWALLDRDPDLASGQLSGTLSLAGRARAPVIDASVALRDGTFGEFHAPYVEGVMSYRNRHLDGTVRLWRLGEEILGVTVGLPVDFALRGADRRRLPGPVEIRARANDVDLALLDAISPSVRRTSGRFSADFGITGTWERPELTGYLAVQDGAASFPALGVRHEQLNGRVVLNGDSLRIERLSLASGGGTADVSGTIELEELTRARLALNIHANDFRAIDVPDFLTATVSGDVQLRGPLHGATLTGRGTVPRGVVWFADIVEKDIINLEDTLYSGLVNREQLRQEGLGSEFENRFLDSLHIDGLQLGMGNDVWLRSNEANIQLTGDLTVGKTAQRYRIDGTLNTPRGTYRLQLIPQVEGFEREFTVTRGQVQYFGTPDLDASLDIDARHVVRTQRSGNLTIFVHVGGTIYNPTLTLSSDHRPTLSETEIISYLLVGAPSVQAAGARGAAGQLGAGFAEAIAARLSGQVAGGLIADLGIPLDYFEVRPQIGGAGGALSGVQVSVGVRLGDRWFVTANPRYCARQVWDVSNIGLGVEYDISRSWRLAAAADPLGSCSLFASDQTTLRWQLGVDLLWETSY